jgi:hypothetical protein
MACWRRRSSRTGGGTFLSNSRAGGAPMTGGLLRGGVGITLGLSDRTGGRSARDSGPDLPEEKPGF